MSWTLLLALGGASYALKAVGPVLAGGRELGPRVRRTLDLVAVPLLAALILVQTLGTGHRLVLDARLPAVAVAAVLVWRRAPFLVVVHATADLLGHVRARGDRARQRLLDKVVPLEQHEVGAAIVSGQPPVHVERMLAVDLVADEPVPQHLRQTVRVLGHRLLLLVVRNPFVRSHRRPPVHRTCRTGWRAGT